MTTPRHSSATMLEARRMAEEGDWTAYGIAKVLSRRSGRPVQESTVRMWIDDQHAERRRAQEAQRMRVANARRSRGRLGAGPPRSPEFKFERIKSLDALGTPAPSIARVMTFDFPDTPISAGVVRQALRDDKVPPVYRDHVHKAVRRARKAA